MYAVFESCGHQFKVSQGDVIQIDGADKKVGDAIAFDRVLIVGDRLGTPTVAGASVTGEVVSVGKGQKLIIQKYRRAKAYRVRNGYRASIYKVKITAISG
ncbi:MAG: 50S ribosomal protein L21 [Planctomycetes bacterium]|nr:50S ribosomal protein L21 [Planctomycetota bacterium]